MLSTALLFLSTHWGAIALFWIAVILLGVSFVAGGTANSAEQFKWGRISAFLGGTIAFIAVVAMII